MPPEGAAGASRTAAAMSSSFRWRWGCPGGLLFADRSYVVARERAAHQCDSMGARGVSRPEYADGIPVFGQRPCRPGTAR